MTRRMSEDEFAIEISKRMRYCHSEFADMDAGFMEIREFFAAEYRFLTTFLGYTGRWSDAREVMPKLDSLLVKLQAAKDAFWRDLGDADLGNYRNYYFAGDLEQRGRNNCYGLGRLSFFQVLGKLSDKIEALKPKIREAYGHLSRIPIRPLRPSCASESYGRQFCVFVERNLEFLLVKYDFVGPLGENMKALKSNLSPLIRLVETATDDWHWKGESLPHFAEVVIQAAHICCFCYYAEMDQTMQRDLAILLADLQQKIDLSSPEFLESILLYPVHLEAQSERRPQESERWPRESERWKTSFVKHILGVQESSVLCMELVTLVTCAIKIMEKKLDLHRFSVDIRSLFVKSRYLAHTQYRERNGDLVLLLARIWFLKAEIFCKEQLSGTNLVMLSMDHQIKALHEGLKFLRTSFTRPMKKTEHLMLVLIEGVLGQVKSFHQSAHTKEYIANKVRDAVYKFLVQIMLANAEELLLELLNSHASFTVPVKRQITTLHEGLILVIEIVINQFKDITEDEKLSLTYTEAVAAGVTSLCHSFLAEETTVEALKEMDLWLLGLLKMVQILEAKLRGLYLEVPKLNFPKTPRLGFIEFLSQKLRQLLNWNLDSIACVSCQIETILEDLEILVSILKDFQNKGIENKELKDLCTHLVHVGYEADHVIDSMVVQTGDVWKHLLWLYHLSEEIRHVKMQIKAFKDMAFDVGFQNAVQITGHEISQTTAMGTVDDMVVLNDQKKVIVNRLKNGSLQREIVSIVGMPGIGKTTLANEVYNDPEIVNYFHIRAWCRVSQGRTKRDLLLEILNCIVALTPDILAKENEDLELLLCQKLRRNRYLIFMDDMWNIQAWDQLQSSFPNDKKGSRILITSRLFDVVSELTVESNILKRRPLSDDESMELLRMKVFPKESFPEELLDVGKEIARNCQGLPLSVVAIAGFLKGRNMRPDYWQQIAKSLNSLIVNDPQTRCLDILELSYKHLPDHLKACFLYFGVFEGEKEIPVWKLTRLWMAEGFIKEKDSKTLEDLAEDFLIDLVGRSLITITKRRSDGRVKACRAHDLVRQLCLLKAEQEKFSKLITCKEQPYASFDDNADLEDIEPSYTVNYNEHRLCISLSRNQFVMSRPTGSTVRSLMFFATTDMYPRCPYDLSFISRNFKLLTVLDLECINMGYSFAAGVDLLVGLSYLAVGGDIDSIPSSVANLRYLETFVVNGLKGKVIVPYTIWRMTRLRHLRVKNRAIFKLQDEEEGSSSHLHNLASLSSLSLSCERHAKEVIKRLPNLRELSCIFLNSGSDAMNCNSFPRFADLTKLEALKVLNSGKSLAVSEFNFPLSLKKLSLSNFSLREDHFSTIGCLEKLEVLKLSSVVFKDREWKMSEGEFPQLKFLKLECVNIMEWNASSNHLPSLQHLVLRKCENLKGVPIDFVGIETLQIIEVQQCRESVEESLRTLKREELDQYGADNLKVLINH